MKSSTKGQDQRCHWLDWLPESSKIVIIPRMEPSKPTEHLLVGGRYVKQIYFKNSLEACFQDVDGRFWHHSFAKNESTELIPGNTDPVEPIPAEVWEAFGSLLGLVVIGKNSEAKKR